MRAAVLEAPERVVLREVPPPVAADGEVVVAIDLAGICGTDVAIYRGKRRVGYPLILGHEAIGRVVAPGTSALAPGTRVVIEPNVPCGVCATCARGDGNVCPAKRSFGVDAPGVFADCVAVPAAFAHPIPDDLDRCTAIFVEPLAVAVHAVSLGRPAAGERVAVIGCGTEGLLLCELLSGMGAQVLALDVRAERLGVATRVGAASTLHLTVDDPASQVASDIERTWQPTLIFEAAGAARATELALHAVCPGGRVVLVGLAEQAVPLEPLWFVRRGLRVLGSLIYDHPADFLRSIDLLRTRRLDPAPLIGQVQLLADIAAVLDRRSSGPAGKVLVDVCGAR